MKGTITSEDAVEFEAHKFVAHASDIGLKPGEWPRTIKTTLGNRQALVRESKPASFGGFIYRQEFGCVELQLLND